MRRLLPYLLALSFGALVSLLAYESPDRGTAWMGLGPLLVLASWHCIGRFERSLRASERSREALESEVFNRSSAERRLHLFRSVVDSSAEMIYVVQPVEGRVVYANEAIVQETGFELSEVVNRPFSELVDELPATASQAQWREWLGVGGGTRLAGQRGAHRRKDGSAFAIAVRASLIEHDEQRFVVVIIEDITERKRREEELERTREELTRLSRMDGLLGIANRRRFDEAFAREWHRAARQGAFLSLVLADIDHFKDYNDRYGHPAGDLCLQDVARVFTEAISRPADLVARYGGEELAVLLPETEAIGAMLVAEDLRGGVEALRLVHQSSAVGSTVTISLGVGTIRPLPSMAPTEFIESVDRALYRAKAAGRNRVEQVQPPAKRANARRSRARRVPIADQRAT